MIHELRIHDSRPDDPRVLCPFALLVDALERTVPGVKDFSWVVLPGAYGYGEHVCHLEDELSHGQPVKVNLGECVAWELKSNETFYNAHFVCPERGIECGVFDSTYHFIRSGDAGLLLKVESCFTTVERVL